jgi:hypothetical protein
MNLLTFLFIFVDDLVLQVAGVGGNVSAANGEVEPKKSKLSVAGPAKSVKGERVRC